MTCTSLAISFGALGLAVGGAIGIAFMACMVMSKNQDDGRGGPHR